MDMSSEYDRYIISHRENVRKGFEWMRDNVPHVLPNVVDLEALILNHDNSKEEFDEYNPYDNYFYGNKSYEVTQQFNRAWLLHIHRNPHHWQHWVLINDNPEEGEIILEMPLDYTIEMICDWWSFGWKENKLTEIFGWYEERKDYIKLHPNTRNIVEYVLAEMKIKLEQTNVNI